MVDLSIFRSRCLIIAHKFSMEFKTGLFPDILEFELHAEQNILLTFLRYGTGRNPVEKAVVDKSNFLTVWN